MLELIAIIFGTALVLVALADIFLTVLYPHADVGLITPRLYPLTWKLFKSFGHDRKAIGQPFPTFAGPLMMVMTVVVWVTLLLFGFALVFWPALGEGIVAGSGPTPTDFGAALYYSGYSLTTLGTGDLVPGNSTQRLLMIAAAGIGFSVLTLSLAYFVSVYAALVRRNTLAQALHHLSAGTGDPIELLKRLAPRGRFDRTSSELSALGFGVLDLTASFKAYPVLHYFWNKEPRYALAKMAYMVLETATLTRSALADEHDEFASSAVVTMLWSGGLDLLESAARSFLSEAEENDPASDNARRFKGALRRLRVNGISTVKNEQTAFVDYLRLRKQWIGACVSFAEKMGYDWDDVEAHDETATQSKAPEDEERAGVLRGTTQRGTL